MSVDGENIKHLEECPGCPECDYLLEFYETCDECGCFGHVDAMKGYEKDRNVVVLCSDCYYKLFPIIEGR